MNAKRLRFVFLAISLVAAAVLTVAADRSHSAGGGVIDPSCTSSLPCIEYDNNGTGPGIRGISVAGNGLAGSTKNAATSVANGRAGLIGNDLGSGTFNSGVHGLSVSGTGVFGQSTNGYGVSGQSAVKAGVFGSTTFNSTSASNFANGVVGQDASTSGTFDSGVEGRSTLGRGVLGVSSSGNGVYGLSSSSNAIVGQTSGAFPNAGVVGISPNGFGLYGQSIDQDGVVGTSTNFAGVVGESINSNGVAASSVNGIGAQVFSKNSIGVFVSAEMTPGPGAAVLVIQGGSSAPFGGAPLIIANNASVGDEMSLDVNGNMILAGTLTTSGTPLIAHRVSSGSLIGTYTAQTTQPVTEDFGEAQLVGGQAYVRLDAGFASVTKRGLQYLVFLTPQGDTKGLYVTQKTAAGFAVHETNGGRSSIAFDYRIVAMAAGSANQRLPQIRDTLYHGRTALRKIPRIPGMLKAIR